MVTWHWLPGSSSIATARRSSGISKGIPRNRMSSAVRPAMIAAALMVAIRKPIRPNRSSVMSDRTIRGPRNESEVIGSRATMKARPANQSMLDAMSVRRLGSFSLHS